MALMFLSPVPIFAAMALIDAFFIYKEHSCKAKLFVTPKAWIVSNALCLLSYGSLIFLPSVWIGLIVSAVSVIMSLCFDGYVQYF
jgi:hypothetical protein